MFQQEHSTKNASWVGSQAAWKDFVRSSASAEPLAIDAPMAGVDVQPHARCKVAERSRGLANLEPPGSSHQRGLDGRPLEVMS